ncbi:hypothetical protein [uncultured Bacteroides sp.]|uniref:plasmid mobilization protein n=1 Tax=uncultured Bacteroides sp. TaxID=162156 RepID=UPI0034A01BC3
MGDVDPRPTPSVNRYAVRFNAKENARFLPMFEQSGAINKATFIKNFFFSRSLSRSLFSMKTHGFSSVSCPR